MIEPTIMKQLIEDKISVDDKSQQIEDDDSIIFSFRSLGLGSPSSSSSSSSSSNDENIIIQEKNLF